MTFNPPIELKFLMPLLLVAAVVLLWLTWRSSRGISSGKRMGLIALRGAVVLAVLAFLLNPGTWQPLERESESYWAVMLDRSASMAISETEGGQSRISKAEEATVWVNEHLAAKGEQVKSYDFAAGLGGEFQAPTALADGGGSQLSPSAIDLLQQSSAAGDEVKGLVIFSDGRQTQDREREALILRAKAFGVPIHTVAIGSDYQAADLDLQVRRRRVVAFPGKTATFSAWLASKSLPPSNQDIELVGPDGKVIATKSVSVDENAGAMVEFAIDSPEQSGTYLLRLKDPGKDARSSNNQDSVYLQVITSKTRVFIAEGAPYWDSKFLAQLLRLQDHMEVHSVYRISEERFFRIDSGDQRPAASTSDIFPSSAEEMNRYDLIVFGKGARHFINPERLKLLRNFVSEQGGAVLFARGKSYLGDAEGLDQFEPVEWEAGVIDEFRLQPTQDGANAGLFGQALPAPENRVWGSLPALRDANRIARTKPFTRILAEGKIGLNGRETSFPLLMVRRFGQGTTAMVNADGLWKWDFYPEARELGNMYQEYWTQLIQWMITYSEFLPGQDFSLRLDEGRVQQGSRVAAKLGYRGKGAPNPPLVELRDSSGKVVDKFTPAQLDDSHWSLSFDSPEPGTYRLQMIDPQTKAPGPDAQLEVLRPPSELDELNPDLEFLRAIAADTGGEFLPSAEPEALETLFKTVEEENASASGGVTWVASWMHWPVAMIATLLLGLEWFLRRRLGLT